MFGCFLPPVPAVHGRLSRLCRSHPWLPLVFPAAAILGCPFPLPIMSRKTTILVLLVILSVITFLDRTCITFSSMEIKADLGMDQSGWGWVMSIFTLSYGLMQVPLGALGDKMGHRWVLALIVLWW